MAEIIMGDLVRQHSAQLVVRGPGEQSSSHVELPVSGARGVNSRVVHDSYPHLAWVASMIRCPQEGQHYPPQTIGLILINRLAAPGARRYPENSVCDGTLLH